MSRENPSLGEVIVNDVTEWTDLPDTGAPYFVLAREGMFLHRKTAQGRGIVPTTKKPTTPKPVGYPSGYFVFTGAEIPATIYAQAVHFFRRIWFKHHTEAEVIITQHKDTGEYRLFIPTQSVSHGGVSSIYNPAHIHRDFLVVGTFHSHCNFGPGHSGIDEGDARDMDGIHGTIGYVDRDVPEMALMYALNGSFFHFQMPFTNVVDMSNLEAATAPEWWDRFVITTKITDEDRAKLAPYADNDQWDKFMRRYKTPVTVTKFFTPQPISQHRALTEYTRDYLGERGEWFGVTRESAEFNARKAAERAGILWDDEGALMMSRPMSVDEQIDAAHKLYEQDFWEDALGQPFVNSLFDTDLITEDDIELALDNADKSGTPEWWERRMRMKLYRAANWLRNQGLTVDVGIRDTRVRTVPGQTTVEEHMQGVIQ